ncbi:MAG TPA: HAD family acid phosphatase, partial [Pyrinomonadaceae bacterium]|nr:HAD family acid phosphatase [Pyrinomonadaceae bacterium]
MNPARNIRLKAASMVAAFLLVTAGAAKAQQPSDNTYIEAATLYQQASGEARALEYQTYMLARMLLDRDLGNRRIKMRRAIIVDVDETILDNSRYQGMLIKKGVNYPEGWTDWCNRAEATSIPGALDFLKYAHARGVRVFYITNRKIAEKDGTARNLKALGFPEVNDET